MEVEVGLAKFSAEDCRKLLSEGRLGEGLAALQRLVRDDPENSVVRHYLGVALHMKGQSREALSQFEEAIAIDPEQPSIYQNYAVALLALGEVEKSLEAAERAVLLRPESVGGYVNLALARIRLKDFGAASAIIEQGLSISPGHPGLLTQAGYLAIEMQDWQQAETFVSAALEASPASIDALYNAGMLHQFRGRPIEAIKAFEKVLAVQPHHEAAFINKGVLIRNLGRADEALRHFASELAHWPNWQVLKYNIAITRLYLRQWPEAWDDYELRSEVAGSLEKTTRPQTPLWDGRDLGTGTLLIVHEQGFGDTFQFVRFIFATIGKAANVIFLCQKRLFNLLSRLDIFRNGKVRLVADDGHLPDHDAYIPLMSLPRLLRTKPQTIPVGICQMQVEPERLERWKSFGLEPGASVKPWRIGLAWQGNPGASVDRERSIPLVEFAPLAKLGRKARLISLQRFFGLDQPVAEGLEIIAPSGEFDASDDAFVDTAILMMTLDLIITSDTATAHLAGLLGRPVWLILKHAPDWRWGAQGLLTEWYPTMRLYRQNSAGDWRGCLEQVAEDLDRLIPDRPLGATTANGRGIAEAIKLHMQGRFGEALEIYRTEHAAGRADPQFLNFLAMAILEEGRRSKSAADQALPFAARSIALAPGMGDFWSNFAVLLDSLASRDDAKRALGFALTVNPDHAPSLISLAKKESADGNSEQALASLKSLLARQPNSGPALSAIASVHSDLKQYKQAEQALRKALEIDPADAKLWVQLGAAQSANNRPQDAADSWARALFHDPKNADAYSNLGVYERTHGALGLSCYLQRRAVECDPNHAEAWNNLGIAELEAARDQAAIGAFNRAITIRPGYPDAHLALGMALLNDGDFENGLKHYEWRLRADKLGITANRPNLPLWRGGDPKGKSFLLMAEQGFGDAFQFSRYAIWLKEHGAAKVFIGCRDKIAHLLKTVPGVDGTCGEGAKLPPADALVYMMSMPALSGMRLETIPAHESYLTADPERVTRWALWLAQKPGFRVGIVWQGNPDPKVDKGRSYPLAALEPLAKIQGVRLIALQKGPGEEQIDALKDRFVVERPGEDYDSGTEAFADTAAMMMNLDLIVTSDTAVAHLAGALGRPCWVVLKAHPEWRWLTVRSDSPWYPMTRLFRRIKDEAEIAPFSAVFERMADVLQKLASGDLAQRHVSEPAPAKAIVVADPVKTYNRALNAQRKNEFATAADLFGDVLDHRPLRANALHMLGVSALHRDRNHRAVVLFREAEQAGLKTPEFFTNYSIGLRRTGRIDNAIAYLRRALEIKPTAEAHLSLGNIFRDECRFEEALENYRAALRINPQMSKAHRGMGNLMRDMHRPEEALAAFERARGIDPGDGDLILDHAHAKFYAGDYIGGFNDYEARWRSKEMKPRTFAVPRWDGTPIPDKTLLVHGEQGFGDNIQFVRFVGEAARRAGTTLLEVRGPLISLFRTIDFGTPVKIVEQGRFNGSCDLEIPMLSLPMVFGTTIDTVPPSAEFHIDAARVAHWKAKFDGPSLKVGLIWQGNPKARADQGRSPPLSALEPLFGVKGVTYVSLQKTDGLQQIAEQPFAKGMIVPGAELGDFNETAAAILALDLVISSCTATLHLAATLGVPTFGMLKYHADWRWLHERDDSPWYPSLRLFRQTAVHDWASVVIPLKAELELAAQKPKVSMA